MTKTGQPKPPKGRATKATPRKKPTKKRTTKGAKLAAPKRPSKTAQERAASAARSAIAVAERNRRWGIGVRAVTAKANAHFERHTHEQTNLRQPRDANQAKPQPVTHPRICTSAVVYAQTPSFGTTVLIEYMCVLGFFTEMLRRNQSRVT